MLPKEWTKVCWSQNVSSGNCWKGVQMQNMGGPVHQKFWKLFLHWSWHWCVFPNVEANAKFDKERGCLLFPKHPYADIQYCTHQVWNMEWTTTGDWAIFLQCCLWPFSILHFHFFYFWSIFDWPKGLSKAKKKQTLKKGKKMSKGVIGCTWIDIQCSRVLTTYNASWDESYR